MDPYLIAHKVRGEPAFDVAIRMTCPLCIGEGKRYELMTECHECDGLGYWWIISTSGHRAYPGWSAPLGHGFDIKGALEDCRNFPSLPDHYPHREAPKVSLAEALGIKPKPQPPILRRL